MQKRSTVVAASVAALAMSAGAAFASNGVPHVFGSGGKHYQFDSMCRRVTFVPPGISNHEAINVLGQQVKCLVHRKTDQAECVANLGDVPAVKVVKKDDWVGVDDLRAYVADLKGCLS